MRRYNPNTKYGRRKMRQDFQHRYHNEMTPEERSENDTWSTIAIVVIFVVICTIVFACCGADGLVNFLKS